MHSRRARPTLRLLAEDLTAGWDSPQPARQLTSHAYDELHPLSELPHPIIAKATESFGPIAENDSFVGPIASSTTLRLLEIKAGQWRGGVWRDPETGVHWLVVAGKAKGEHQDRDDFYQRVQRENDNGDPNRWLPTDHDTHLLKQETAARLVTEWELSVQRQMLDALRAVQAGGSTRVTVSHPHPDKGTLAQLTLVVTPVRETDYKADEIELEVNTVMPYAGSHLTWHLTVRVLISVSPPEQGWDRYKDTYTNIAEPGEWTRRVTELESLVADGKLAESEPGQHCHYAHREHLAGRTIEGQAVRALCGAFFVPIQDHEKLPRCPQCEERYNELPT